METVLYMLFGLEAKHLLADYMLQTPWMIAGKKSFLSLGGYVHAGLHGIGTAAVFYLIGLPAQAVVMLAVIDSVVHYLLDYSKAHYAAGVSEDGRPRMFWALNGVDQFFHRLTYLGLMALAVWLFL